MPDAGLFFSVVFVVFAAVVLYSALRRRGSAKTRPRETPPAPPTMTATYPQPAVPSSIEKAARARKALATTAEANRWAVFDPKDRTATIEGLFHAGTEDYEREGRSSGFTDEQLALGRTIREWHPYWKEGLSSFIYHHTDLLDADGVLIAQAMEAEDVRD